MSLSLSSSVYPSVLKSEFNGDVRRLTLSPDVWADFSLVSNHIFSLYGLNSSQALLKFRDDDEELITIVSSSDWEEALKVANQMKAKSIKLQVALKGQFQANQENVNAAPNVFVEDFVEVSDPSTPKENKEENRSQESKAQPTKADFPPFVVPEAEILDFFLSFFSSPDVRQQIPMAINQVLDGFEQGKNSKQLIEILLKSVPNMGKHALIDRLIMPLINDSVIMAHLDGLLALVQPLLVTLIPQLRLMLSFAVPMLLTRLDSIDWSSTAHFFHQILSRLHSNVENKDEASESIRQLFSGISLCGFPIDFGLFESNENQSIQEIIKNADKKLDDLMKKSEESHQAICNECFPSDDENSSTSIVGTRWKCSVCPDYDLCDRHEKEGKHPVDHPLMKFKQPEKGGIANEANEKKAEENEAVHHGIVCDSCSTSPIRGIRYKCSICRDYDLCHQCEKENKHNPAHPLIKIQRPQANRCPGMRFARHDRSRPFGCRSRSWRRSESADADNHLSLSSKFIRDVNLPDESVVESGSAVVKTWLVQNNGNQAWPDGSKLIFLRGDRQLIAEEEFEIPSLIQPGQSVEISVAFFIPADPPAARYSIFFRLADKDRNCFGTRIWAELKAEPPKVEKKIPQPPIVNEEKSVEPYQTELDALAVLGFGNRELNAYLLQHHKGNVQAVANWLLEQSQAKHQKSNK
jgi:hypothetical protein